MKALERWIARYGAPQSGRFTGQALCIDTRRIQSGDVFVAFDGANMRGIDFLEEALLQGAHSVVTHTHHEKLLSEALSEKKLEKVFFTDDLQVFVEDYGRLCLKNSGAKIIAVTGSVGKTSTKNMIHYLLSRFSSVISTAGNYNNHLGVPITLSRLNSSHDWCVVEMGANQKGDIAALCDVAPPNISVLTPVGPSHLKGFKSIKGIYETKTEILNPEAPPNKVILMSDDPQLRPYLGDYEGVVVKVGTSTDADYVIQSVSLDSHGMRLTLNDRIYRIPIFLKRAALNVGLAIAAVIESTGFHDLPEDWKDFVGEEHRMQRFQSRGVSFLDDTYNSNPISFEAALESFSEIESPNKWLVFSDMLELGDEEIMYHEQLGDKIARLPLSGVFAYGTLSEHAILRIQESAPQMKAQHFKDAESLVCRLVDEAVDGDTVLLKGSRGMRVEQVLSLFKNQQVSKS